MRLHLRPSRRVDHHAQGTGKIPNHPYPMVKNMMTIKKKLGMAIAAPDFRTPRKLMTVMNITDATAISTRYSIQPQDKRKRSGPHRKKWTPTQSGCNPSKARRPQSSGDLSHVIAGYDVRAAAIRIGVNDLFVRDGDDCKQNNDRNERSEIRNQKLTCPPPPKSPEFPGWRTHWTKAHPRRRRPDQHFCRSSHARHLPWRGDAQ